VLRMLLRNLIIMAHNFIIFPLLLLLLGKSFSVPWFISIAGVFLVTLNLAWISINLGMLCARYRDFAQIVTSFLQVIFYLTPVMWLPSLLEAQYKIYLIYLNPFYYMLDAIRAPLLQEITWQSSFFCLFALTVIGWLGTFISFGRYRNIIVYWL
jgi:ABC-type polysaccharide/polyol phosphate export permease